MAYFGASAGFVLFVLLMAVTYLKNRRVRAWQILVYLIISSVLAALLHPVANKVPLKHKTTR